MAIPCIVLIVALAVGFPLNSLEAFGVPSSVAIIPSATDNGAALVCAIVFKNSTRSVECSNISAAGAGEAFPLYPAVSFASLSGGGHGSLCGLQFDGASFFCWNQTSNHGSNGTRVYHNDTVPLRDLVVGESQVAASDQNGTFIRWWFAGRDFPASFPGNFRSHTSGADFTCAIDSSNGNVTKCWGPRGGQIQAAFADQAMSTVVAGRFRACGVATDGRLLCSESGFGQPPFEFESLALGPNHTCVLRSSDGAAACWGAGGDDYAPAKNLSFRFLVASGNVFCGLAAESYNIHCWWTNRRPSPIVELPLHSVVPGICAKESSCDCGVAPSSSKYCLDSGVVCQLCTWRRPPSSHRPWLTVRSWIVFTILGVGLVLICIWSQLGRNWNVRAQNPHTPTTGSMTESTTESMTTEWAD